MQSQVFGVVVACNVVGLSCKPGWVLNPQVLMMYVMALQTLVSFLGVHMYNSAVVFSPLFVRTPSLDPSIPPSSILPHSLPPPPSSSFSSSSSSLSQTMMETVVQLTCSSLFAIGKLDHDRHGGTWMCCTICLSFVIKLSLECMTAQDEEVARIAEKNDRTVAQTLLRWGLQRGTSVIPKSDKKAHSQVHATCSLHKLDKALHSQVDANCFVHTICLCHTGKAEWVCMLRHMQFVHLKRITMQVLPFMGSRGDLHQTANLCCSARTAKEGF